MATTDLDGPADTRLMGIVHEALRRDLRRTQQVLGGERVPERHQRQAIAAHLGWMMQFLHAHHASEDQGLYPMVRDRDPAAAELLDQMHREHSAIGPAVAAVERGADAYRLADDGTQRQRLLSAVEQLEQVLLPHLLREEDELMPVVSATITDGELRRWDEEANIKPKSLRQLGREGHWIIDDLTPEDRDIVVHLVPAVPRFVLVHGFARGYRRQRAACWGSTASSRRRVQRRGRVDVVVDAAPEAVWDVVRDVTRVGEWSHECVGADWLGGATSAAPGARFRGRNRSGLLRWGRVCEVVDVHPGEIAWRTVPTLFYPDSAEWRITLDHVDDGTRTRIEQTFQVLKAPRLLEPVYATLVPTHRDRTRALAADLRRLGALAAAPRSEPAADRR